MRILIIAAVLFILPLISAPCFADGLLDRLPADGTWARYEYVNNVGENETRMGTLWMASVGQATVKGEVCRWIEIRMEEETFNRPIRKTRKVLVPERHLGRGKSPLKHVVQAWYKSGDRDAKELDFKNFGPLQVWLASPLDDVKQLPEEIVSSKLGDLACLGIKQTGKLFEKEAELKTRLHPKAPFGVVTHEFRLKTEADFVTITTMKLSDFGDGAKSDVPEQVTKQDVEIPGASTAESQADLQSTSEKDDSAKRGQNGNETLTAVGPPDQKLIEELHYATRKDLKERLTLVKSARIAALKFCVEATQTEYEAEIAGTMLTKVLLAQADLAQAELEFDDSPASRLAALRAWVAAAAKLENIIRDQHEVRTLGEKDSNYHAAIAARLRAEERLVREILAQRNCAPGVICPESTRVGELVVFQIVAIDPKGAPLRYELRVRKQGEREWSFKIGENIASGETCSYRNNFTVWGPGKFLVQARSFNGADWSSWSDPRTVLCNQ